MRHTSHLCDAASIVIDGPYGASEEGNGERVSTNFFLLLKQREGNQIDWDIHIHKLIKIFYKRF